VDAGKIAPDNQGLIVFERYPIVIRSLRTDGPMRRTKVRDDRDEFL